MLALRLLLACCLVLCWPGEEQPGGNASASGCSVRWLSSTPLTAGAFARTVSGADNLSCYLAGTTPGTVVPMTFPRSKDGVQVCASYKISCFAGWCSAAEQSKGFKWIYDALSEKACKEWSQRGMGGTCCTGTLCNKPDPAKGSVVQTLGSTGIATQQAGPLCRRWRYAGKPCSTVEK